MSERIIVAFATRSEEDGISKAAASDIRYTGIIPKKKFHPRLLIRKFRSTPSMVGGLPDGDILELDNFILESAQEGVAEKFQIVQTFGPDFIFFYGRKPRIFTYSGRLFNTQEKAWKNDWQRAWDRDKPIVSSGFNQRSILSGTNLVLNGAIARLEYDGSSGTDVAGVGLSNIGLTNPIAQDTAIIVREGYLLSLDIQLDSKAPNSAMFKFSMFITNLMTY